MKLTATTVEQVLGNLPWAVKHVMRTRNLMVAGGFVRDLLAGAAPKDIDLFGISAREIEQAFYDLINISREGGYEVTTLQTNNAYTVRVWKREPLPGGLNDHTDEPKTQRVRVCPDIQLVLMDIRPNHVETLMSLDFRCCQVGVWFDAAGPQGYVAEGTLDDIAEQRLVYTRPDRQENPVGSLNRARKLMPRGWKMGAENLVALVARSIAGNPNAPIEGVTEENVKEVLGAELHRITTLAGGDYRTK